MKSIDFEKNWNKNVHKPLLELIKLNKNGDIIIFSTTQNKKKITKLKQFSSKYPNCYLLESSVNLNGKEYNIHELDDHPNKTAHQIYAQELFSFIIKKNLIKKSENSR